MMRAWSRASPSFVHPAVQTLELRMVTLNGYDHVDLSKAECQHLDFRFKFAMLHAVDSCLDSPRRKDGRGTDRDR